MKKIKAVVVHKEKKSDLKSSRLNPPIDFKPDVDSLDLTFSLKPGMIKQRIIIKAIEWRVIYEEVDET